MPLLQVRKCPEDIYKKVAYVAKQENRTIAQQVIILLQKGLHQEQSNIERRTAVLDRISNRDVSDKAKKIDEVQLLREDRDR